MTPVWQMHIFVLMLRYLSRITKSITAFELYDLIQYERTKIKEYAARYGIENDATVARLLDEEDGGLFDLQKPVKDCLVLPVAGYGLKAICKHEKLVDFQWEDDDSGSQWWVVQYVNFLNETDPAQKERIRQSILGYNRDDVIATHKLEKWLKDIIN